MPLHLFQSRNVKTVLVDFENYGANVGRSGHTMSIEAGKIIFDAREKLAKFTRLKNPLKMLFLLIMQHTLNLAINGIVKEGDIVVTLPFEHNSVKEC